jgi:hypothetical protein
MAVMASLEVRLHVKQYLCPKTSAEVRGCKIRDPLNLAEGCHPSLAREPTVIERIRDTTSRSC